VAVQDDDGRVPSRLLGRKDIDRDALTTALEDLVGLDDLVGLGPDHSRSQEREDHQCGMVAGTNRGATGVHGSSFGEEHRDETFSQ
jgi:hypothetical protein